MTVTDTTTTQQGDITSMKKRKHCEVEEDGDGSDTLHVVVRRVGKPENESLVLELGSDATVLDLKEKIAESLEDNNEIAIPTERQRLIFSGKMLRDESAYLEADLNMKSGDDHKHFVHLTPLPKGAAPSVRTERELSDNPASTQEATIQRARARQRRRRRQEARPGMSDPAAYHPYALDLASGSLLPSASSPASSATASLGLSSASNEAADLLSMAVAAQQARLVQEVAARAALPEALQAALLSQQHSNLFSAAAGNSAAAAAVLTNSAGLCPFGNQSDALSNLLAGRTAPSAASILGSFAQAPVAAAPMPTDAASLLQELLARQQQQQPQRGSNDQLPEILEQIAANAGELANTLRLLSPTAAAAPSAASAPQQSISDLARRLLLEDRLASLSSSTQGSYFSGGLPNFF